MHNILTSYVANANGRIPSTIPARDTLFNDTIHPSVPRTLLKVPKIFDLI